MAWPLRLRLILESRTREPALPARAKQRPDPCRAAESRRRSLQEQICQPPAGAHTRPLVGGTPIAEPEVADATLIAMALK